MGGKRNIMKLNNGKQETSGGKKKETQTQIRQTKQTNIHTQTQRKKKEHS